MSIKDIPNITVTTFNEWLDDKTFKMSAALSFYSLISLAPLLLIITSIAGAVFGKQAAAGQLFEGIQEYVGLQSAELIQKLVMNASVPDTGITAAVLGIAVFLWASLAIFVELRDSLNAIWGVEVKPGKGFKVFFISRIFSFLILLIIGLLLVVSLIAGTLLSVLDSFLSDLIGNVIPLLHIIDMLFSFLLVTLMFAVIMKILPSVKVEWRYAFIGAVITSILFSIGKFGINYYLSTTSYSSVYGAASSLVILLFWIYYSGLIFFFGAELTQVLRKKYSKEPLQLDKNVLRISKISEMIKEKTGVE